MTLWSVITNNTWSCYSKKNCRFFFLGGSGGVGKGECSLSFPVSGGRKDFSSDISAVMMTLWNFNLQIQCKRSPSYLGETLAPAPSPPLAEALSGLGGVGLEGMGSCWKGCDLGSKTVLGVGASCQKVRVCLWRSSPWSLIRPILSYFWLLIYFCCLYPQQHQFTISVSFCLKVLNAESFQKSMP